MNKIEILKSFLEDDIIKEKYGFSDAAIENMDFVTHNPNSIIELLRYFITVIEDKRHIESVVSSNLHRFLENQLSQKK